MWGGGIGDWAEQSIAYHKVEDEHLDPLACLWGDVHAELHQGTEEPLDLAQGTAQGGLGI